MQSKASFKSRINSLYRDLSPTEKKIADYISENIKEVSHSPINDVCAHIGVANSSLYQFTRKLGYKGYTDFKVALLTESFDPEISVFSKIDPNDSDTTIVKKVYEAGIHSMKEAETLIDGDAFTKATDYIVRSKHVGFFGLGGSNIIAEHGYHKFLRSPVDVIYASDYDFQIMNVSKLTDKDTVILISHSGLTEGTNELAKIANTNKSHVIAITSHENSPLAKEADVVLLSTASELEYRSESMPNRMSQYSIIDSLFFLTMLRDTKKSNASMDKVKQGLEFSSKG